MLKLQVNRGVNATETKRETDCRMLKLQVNRGVNATRLDRTLPSNDWLKLQVNRGVNATTKQAGQSPVRVETTSE